MGKKNASSGSYKAIGNSLRAHPEFLFSDIFQAIQNILHHRCAYPVVKINEIKSSLTIITHLF